MIHPLSMFAEKDGTGAFSMTRLIAWLFALIYLLTLWTYADKAIPINWPFAILGCVVLLAVPIQAIFKYLGTYIDSRQGRALITKLIENVVPGASTVASTVSSVVTTTPAEKG